jgi:hypothetical protein
VAAPEQNVENQAAARKLALEEVIRAHGGANGGLEVYDRHKKNAPSNKITRVL